MEFTGVGEAAQFINVVVSGAGAAANLGFEALKLTGNLVHFAGHEIKQLVKLLYAAQCKRTLANGEARLSDIVNSANSQNVGIGVMSVSDDLKADFVEYCKSAGISYSILPDVNRADGRFEVIYAGTQANQTIMEYYMSNKKGQVFPTSFLDYVKNAEPTEMLNVESELKKTAPEQYEMFKSLENDLRQEIKTKTETSSESFKIDKSQILAVANNTCEITLRDSENNRYYIDVPVSMLNKTDSGEFILSLDSNSEYFVNNSSGFIKNPNGTFIDVRQQRNTPDYRCSAKMIKDLAQADSEFRKKNRNVGQAFKNTMSKDNNVVVFPTKSVAEKKGNYIPTPPTSHKR